eukprot:562650-Pyramimonas_sp.AAC.1
MQWRGGPFRKYWQRWAVFWHPLLSYIGALCISLPVKGLEALPGVLQFASHLSNHVHPSSRTAARR